MPSGIYLNARWLGAQKLAMRMNYIIQNPESYYDFFKWHGLYSFHNIDDDQQHDAVCGLCAVLNNNSYKSQKSLHKTNIFKFWNIFDYRKNTLEKEHLHM